MATAQMPDEFDDLVAHHLPPEPPRVGPQGGRPWVGHRAVVRVIWCVLASGLRWAGVPAELGGSGRTARCGRGRRPASGTGCTPTASGASARPASRTPTWWWSTLWTSGRSGAESRPAPARWTAANWGRSTPGWSAGRGCRWPSGRPGRTERPHPDPPGRPPVPPGRREARPAGGVAGRGVRRPRVRQLGQDGHRPRHRKVGRHVGQGGRGPVPLVGLRPPSPPRRGAVPVHDELDRGAPAEPARADPGAPFVPGGSGRRRPARRPRAGRRRRVRPG